MKKIQRWLAAFAVGIVAAGGLTLGVAAPASANYIDITCTTAWLEPHRALTNGDHINIDITQDGKKSQVNAYVDRNIAGGWDTLGLRLNTPGGQVQVPLTEAEVKSGRLTFNFGQYLTGTYTVEWAQFNNSYFNQDRKPNKFLNCGEQEQPKKVVVCKYVSTPGLGERPSHLIEVSVNALKDFPGTFPWAFNDAQGGSVALGYAPGEYTLADCPYERPEQPAALKGVEKRELTPVCVEPLDGTATIARQERAWEQKYVWDGSKGWVLGEKAYTGDWTTVSTETVDSQDCTPPEPEIPVKPEDRDPVKTSVPGGWQGGEPTCKDTEVEQTREVTHTETTYDWIFNKETWEWESVSASSTWTTTEKRTLTWEGGPCVTPTPTPTPDPTPTPEPTPEPTPTPSVTPEPTPTPTGTPEPTPSASETPVPTPEGELPPTGGQWNPAILTAGLVLAVGGTATYVLSRLRRQRKMS